MKKIIKLSLLIGVLCFSPLFASGQQEAVTRGTLGENAAGDSVTITDCMGREVTVKRPVKRIAFCHFATGEALKILDAWDLVAGRSEHVSNKIIYPELDDIPIVVSGQNAYDLNYEKIYELDIDLFLTVDIPIDGFDEMLAKLEPGIPVAVLNFHEAQTFKENFENLGILLGKEQETAEYLEWFDGIMTRISNTTASIAQTEKPSIFLKTGWGRVDDLQTFTDVLPGFPERNDITGSINIAAEVPSSGGWVQAVDQEWLVAQRLDVLVVMDYIAGAFGADVDDNTIIRMHREQVMALPAFSDSNAVKNGRVYMIPSEFYGSPQFIIGYAYMAKWFHPDLFPDLDPKKLHQEYLTRFMRIDFDLSEHGVFVYPEEY